MTDEKIKKIAELCKDITIVNQNGSYRPVKNTSAQECYRVLFKIIKLIGGRYDRDREASID